MTTRRIQLERGTLPEVAHAELVIYGDERHAALKGRFDRDLAYHALKIAEILGPFEWSLHDYTPARGELTIDGKFIAFRIVNVTIDNERPGL